MPDTPRREMSDEAKRLYERAKKLPAVDLELLYEALGSWNRNLQTRQRQTPYRSQ